MFTKSAFTLIYFLKTCFIKHLIQFQLQVNLSKFLTFIKQDYSHVIDIVVVFLPWAD